MVLDSGPMGLSAPAAFPPHRIGKSRPGMGEDGTGDVVVVPEANSQSSSFQNLSSHVSDVRQMTEEWLAPTTAMMERSNASRATCRRYARIARARSPVNAYGFLGNRRKNRSGRWDLTPAARCGFR